MTLVYGGVYHTRLRRFSKADCSTTERGANAERHVFGKLSARRFQRRPFRRPALFQLWRYRAWKIGPGAFDIHRRIGCTPSPLLPQRMPSNSDTWTAFDLSDDGVPRHWVNETQEAGLAVAAWSDAMGSFFSWRS